MVVFARLMRGLTMCFRLRLRVPVKQVYAANARTIEVLRASFPYAIVWSQQNLPAIVHMTHNSQEEGHSLADVCLGTMRRPDAAPRPGPPGTVSCFP